MHRAWSLVARRVFPISGRHWVVVWGEPEGDEIKTGDRLVAQAEGREVAGVIEGLELHRLLDVPDTWVGVQVGGPAAEVTASGTTLTHEAPASDAHDPSRSQA